MLSILYDMKSLYETITERKYWKGTRPILADLVLMCTYSLFDRPCSQVVLWKPSGVDFLRKEAESTSTSANRNDNSLSVNSSEQISPSGRSSCRSSPNGCAYRVLDYMKDNRKKKCAVRSLTTNSCLLNVPKVRPATPPPNTKYVCDGLVLYCSYLFCNLC